MLPSDACVFAGDALARLTWNYYPAALHRPAVELMLESARAAAAAAAAGFVGEHQLSASQPISGLSLDGDRQLSTSQPINGLSLVLAAAAADLAASSSGRISCPFFLRPRPNTLLDTLALRSPLVQPPLPQHPLRARDLEHNVDGVRSTWPWRRRGGGREGGGPGGERGRVPVHTVHTVSEEGSGKDEVGGRGGHAGKTTGAGVSAGGAGSRDSRDGGADGGGHYDGVAFVQEEDVLEVWGTLNPKP